MQEQPKKPKRKGFLGIFGKKEEAKPTVTTTMHRSFNRNMRTEQQAQSRRLSVHADSLAARNAELNRQLQGLVVQIDGKVQTDLQKREAEITAMRERSFIQIGGLTGFVILLLVISYIIIHRNANRIKRYKQETADLIERLQQMAKRNEALIASRKKAVHTITHELRTPLTAITGYAGLMRKDCNTDKTGTYIRNIQESSDRMREMLNTLLNFFRLDNGKEQPNFSACRISAITHTLETEFMPIADFSFNYSSLFIDNHLLISKLFAKFTYPFRDAEGLILTKISRYETDKIQSFRPGLVLCQQDWPDVLYVQGPFHLCV